MIFVDTGFLLALSQPADALHTRARAWANILSEPLVVTEYILWETVNRLSQPVDRAKGHRLVQYVSSAANYELVVASRALFNAGLELHADRDDKDWSLTDCISFIVMQRRSIKQALAYDHHFEQAGFEALLRRDPP
jgi:uncharacterized protein